MISVVIPAYNEAVNVENTIDNIRLSLSKTEFSDNYEIIVIDDHSLDNTYQLIEQLADKKISCIRLSKRSGSHTAVRAGLSFARGDMVLYMAADGQEDPETIKEMLFKCRNGAHIVWGVRNSRKNEPLSYKLPTWIFYKVLKFFIKSNNNINYANADFFLLNRKVVDAINSCKEKNTSLLGLIAWSGFNQDYIMYDRKKRKAGCSGWDFLSRIRLAEDWLIAFSSFPFKTLLIIGSLITGMGFLYSVFSLFTENLAEYNRLIIPVILMLSGIQMGLTGILGLYISKNLDESRGRPLYFIENSTFENNVRCKYHQNQDLNKTRIS